MADIKDTNINPDLLVWARQESGYAPERIAKRLQVKSTRVLDWEKGERAPTIKQMERIAQFLHRPLSLFFLPQPPKIVPLAAEHRRLPGIKPSQESPELRLALRQMVLRRENAINLTEELDQDIPDFTLRAHLTESPEKVGDRLRLATGITSEEQLVWPNEWRAWADWRRSIEALGIFVFQFGKVSLNEVRGIALLRTPLPVVGINSKEIPEAKSYTLIHETIHLMLSEGHEEASALEEKRSESEWNEVERFVEAAASYALVPEYELKKSIPHAHLTEGHWDLAQVRQLARTFRITPLAMATRLRYSGYMTWEHYKRWRVSWENFVKTLPPRKGGFSDQVEKAVNRSGRPFSKLVLEALESNRITSVDAARFLELKFEHFGLLKSYLTPRSSRQPLAEY